MFAESAAAAFVSRVIGVVTNVFKLIGSPIVFIFFISGKLLSIKSVRLIRESFREVTFRTLSAQLMSLLLIVCIITTSTPAAAPTLLFISANEFRQDVRYSLIANFGSSTLAASISLFSVLDWVGAVNPVLGVITASGIFKKRKQDQKPEPPQRIVILPNNETNTLTVLQGEKLNLTAIGLNAKDQPIGGLQFNWTVADTLRNRPPRSFNHGVFDARLFGTFVVTAESHGKQAQINIIVNPNEGLGMQRLLQKAQLAEASLNDTERGMLQNLAQKGVLTTRRISTKGNHNREEEERLHQLEKQRREQVKLKQNEIRAKNPNPLETIRQRWAQPNNPNQQLNQPRPAGGPNAESTNEPLMPDTQDNETSAATEAGAKENISPDNPGKIEEKTPDENGSNKESADDLSLRNSDKLITAVAPSRTAANTKSSVSSAMRRPPDEDSWDSGNYWIATEPYNQIGTTPGAAPSAGSSNGNFGLAAPVISLPGRGLDVNLSLYYNSRLWSRIGNLIAYDADKGSPAPGWNLGFGKLINLGSAGCMVVDADGTRHAHDGTNTTYSWTGYFANEYAGYSTDGSFINYSCTYTSSTYNNFFAGHVRLANGTTISYGSSSSTFDQAYPTKITDAQGNYITITYVNNQGPNIQTITDTLGRVISFNYDGGGRLVSIVGPAQNGGSRVLVRLHYAQLNLNYAFNGLTPDTPTNQPFVLDAIYYPDINTGYWFGDGDSYSSYGMIAKVKGMRGMSWSGANNNDQGTITQGNLSHQQQYNYPLGPDPNLTDAPLYTTRTETWDQMTTAPAVTTYAVTNTPTEEVITVTAPDGTKNVQTSYNSPGAWNDGVYYKNEQLSPSNAVLGKMQTYMQAGDWGSFRPTRIETTDEKNQTTAVEFEYANGVYNQVTKQKHLNYANQLYRETRTAYENNSAYTNLYRHIFSLVKTQEVFDAGGNRLSRVDYEYDNNAVVNGPANHNLMATPGVIMHNYLNDPYTTQTYQGNCINGQFNYSECSYDGQPINVYDPYVGDFIWQTCVYECTEYEQVSAYDPNTVFRGNVTKVTTYENAAAMSGAISYDYTYDVTGNQRTATTNCCQQMSFDYAQTFQYAYPHSMTKGSSDPNSPHRMTQGSWYDYNTGLQTSATDFNGRITWFHYDAVNRPSVLVYPTGGYENFYYNDGANATAHRLTEANHGVGTYTESFKNGRGQEIRGRIFIRNTGNFYDAVNFTDTASVYDQMGRKTQVSMPYSSAASPTQWTTYNYDYLSRVTQVTAPDGSISQTMYNEATRPSSASSLPGQTVRSRDAWGRERWALADDFGRVTDVVEPDPNGTGSVFDPGSVQTSYAYDALDRLTAVYQGAQQRRFAYDSLGRLIRQKLAEQNHSLNDAGQFVGVNNGNWSDAFVYDNRSNLIQRTDARGVKTNYNYTIGGNPDPLNRLQAVSYDTSGADTTHAIPNTSPTYLTYMTAGDKTRVASAGTWYANEENSYDVEGRIAEYKITYGTHAAQPMVTSYLYDTLNRVTEIRYPAQYGVAGSPRKVVTPSYDETSRLKELKVDNQIQMSEIAYNPLSQVTQLKTGAATGNADIEQYSYDAQTALLTNQKVIKQNTSQVLLDLSYGYSRTGSGGASNGTINGKTGQLTGIVNNLDHNKNRFYEFDSLGRLKAAKGGAASGWSATANWQQAYGYDRYGNRTSVTASGITANSQNVPTDGLPSQSYDQGSNRISTAGYQYDLAGNLVRGQRADGAWQKYEYDAAGRLKVVKRDSDGWIEQVNEYSASRQRVLTWSYGSTGITRFVWGGSQVIAEYKANSWDADPLVWQKSYIYAGSRLLSTFTNNGSGGETLEFHHPDRLGTKLVTNNTANNSFEQSTLPFGTELAAESTGATNQRFTSYDRSTVAQLDYAVNRSYSSGTGRFTSVDPAKDGSNLYAYANNDPINNTDPTGLYSEIGGGMGDFERMYEFWGERLADLPGYGTMWGSFSQLGERMYEERLQNTRDAIAGNNALQQYLNSDGEDTAALDRFLKITSSNSSLALQVSSQGGSPLVVPLDTLKAKFGDDFKTLVKSFADPAGGNIGECFSLVKALVSELGDPNLSTQGWVQGAKLFNPNGTPTLALFKAPIGAAIATFDENGRVYSAKDDRSTHGAILLHFGIEFRNGRLVPGIYVIDQWKKRGEAGRRFIPVQNADLRSNDAREFSLVVGRR